MQNIWIPKLNGSSVNAINAKTGAKRVFYCGNWKGPTSVSAVGSEFAIQCGDGKVRIWNPDSGQYRQIN